MKKTLLSAALLASVSSIMPLQAAKLPSFSEQLMMQKTQLNPQEFNFFSDRYKQIMARQRARLSGLEFEGAAFKFQLDSQRDLLRDYNLYPVVNVSYQSHIRADKPSFKTQLDSQKELLRPQLFSFISDAYYQVISR